MAIRATRFAVFCDHKDCWRAVGEFGDEGQAEFHAKQSCWEKVGRRWLCPGHAELANLKKRKRPA